MDVYAIALSYPRRPTAPDDHNTRPVPRAVPDAHYASHVTQLTSPSDAQITTVDIPPDVLQKSTLDAIQAHACHVSYARPENAPGWNIHLSGSYLQVMAARGHVLRESAIQVRCTIKVPRNDILDNPSSTPTLKPEVRSRLDEIAEQASTNISVINPTAPGGVLATSPAREQHGLESEKPCELQLLGTMDCVEIARVRLLVMLDELAGLHSECCEIDHKLHAIIAGRKRSALQSIQEETGTNIYFPSPLHGAIGATSAPTAMAAPSVPGIVPPRHNNNVIWITGEPFGVQRARDTLFHFSINKVRNKNVISREAAILPRKIDWLLTDRIDDLKGVMNDNATYIAFPPLGSQASLITVFGDNRVNVQRTIRCVMQLACQFYVASFWLLPSSHFNPMMPNNTINMAQIPSVLQRVSQQSGAEVVFKSNCFEVHGLAHEVRTAIQLIAELDIVQGFHHDIRFQLELANEQREFISGKKNGKINKIMQAANVKIKFETFNDHNFLIDVCGNDLGVLQGLDMIHEELPAELSFHVPESYHKRIIGVGGKSIQRIMKKYGVYVKFSNAEELAAIGGYMDIEDNVVARTPAKNAMALESLKQAIMELVNPKDKDFVVETLSVPRRYHRTLLGEKSVLIHDIESKTNSRIRFPDKETGSDIVTIFGPESQVHITGAMLLDHIPFEVEMPVPYSPELTRFSGSAAFESFNDKIKREFQVSVVPSIRTLTTPPTSASSGSGKRVSWHECSFRLACQRSNSDSLATVRDMLEQVLIEHNVRIYPPSGSHKRADSFAEAFPHFNSKLLSSATSPDTPEITRPVSGHADRKVRMASSSPDVKALFNGSAYVNQFPPEQEGDEIDDKSNSFSPDAFDDYWTPLPTINSNVHMERNRMEDALKRGSDSLLEKKIKEQIAKPRSLSNRAQSLDLTFHMARMTDHSSVPPPDSPTNSIYELTRETSPTVTAPSFPSVYGPPLVAPPGRMSSVNRLHSYENPDDLSQGISGLRI